MVLYLRTEIAGTNPKPDRELEIPVINTEFQPFNKQVEFLRETDEEWDHISILDNGMFEYQNTQYDFCFLYPKSMK